MYKQVILSISDAKISTSTTAATSSVTFFELCGDFFFLISSITMESFSVNLNLIITLGNKIVDAGNLGVSVSSQRFIIIYNIIIKSLEVVVNLVGLLGDGLQASWGRIDRQILNSSAVVESRVR